MIIGQNGPEGLVHTPGLSGTLRASHADQEGLNNAPAAATSDGGNRFIDAARLVATIIAVQGKNEGFNQRSGAVARHGRQWIINAVGPRTLTLALREVGHQERQSAELLEASENAPHRVGTQ